MLVYSGPMYTVRGCTGLSESVVIIGKKTVAGRKTKEMGCRKENAVSSVDLPHASFFSSGRPESLHTAVMLPPVPSPP